MCGGRASLNLTGNETKFSDNDHSLRILSGSCMKDCSGLSSSLALEVCGRVGTTAATYVMSSLLVIIFVSLVIYHIVYVVYLLPIKKKEEDEYFALHSVN
jgi:hypothetical protein